jgi:hypothetical protein
MATITESECKIHLQHLGTSPETSNPFGLKCFGVEVPDTSDNADDVTLTLATYGLTYLEDIWMFTHSTTDDIIITESTEFVSSVTAGVLTVTIQGSTANKKRFIVVWGR